MVLSKDVAAARMAASQAGCLRRRQAHELGVSDRMIERRLKTGLWTRRHPGVYALRNGCSDPWLEDVWAAVLAVGERVAVTHETALLLRGAVPQAEAPLHPIVLTVPHGRHHRIDGAVVHQIDDLRAHHTSTIGQLVVSRSARAIVDIAATAGARRLARLIDGLLVDRKTTIAEISACLHEVARPGKPGVVRLGVVLDQRGEGYVPPESELERRLFDALSAAGLPAPRRQVRLPGRGAIEGVVDAAYPDVQLILEADGRRWHGRQAAFTTDRARDAEAARVGWQTLRFVWEQVVGDPAEVAATVADVRRIRRAQLPLDNAAA